jgi:hypothetical protein
LFSFGIALNCFIIFPPFPNNEAITFFLKQQFLNDDAPVSSNVKCAQFKPYLCTSSSINIPGSTIRGCQIFWAQNIKIGKNVPKWPQKYLIAIEYTGIAIKIPNGNEVDKTFPSQGLPKLAFLV